MPELKRADIVSIALTAAAMLLVGAAPAYSASASAYCLRPVGSCAILARPIGGPSSGALRDARAAGVAGAQP